MLDIAACRYVPDIDQAAAIGPTVLVKQHKAKADVSDFVTDVDQRVLVPILGKKTREGLCF